MTNEYQQILMTLQEMKDQLHTIEDDIVALKQDFDEIYFSGDEDDDEDEKGEEEEGTTLQNLLVLRFQQSCRKEARSFHEDARPSV